VKLQKRRYTTGGTHHTSPDSTENPADVVAALNELLGAFSRDIAAELDAI